jgi:hypothetical protein
VKIHQAQIALQLGVIHDFQERRFFQLDRKSLA